MHPAVEIMLEAYYEGWRARGIWVTEFGVRIVVDQITDDHLSNIARMLRGYGARDFPSRGVMAKVWLDTIEDEMDRRGLQALSVHESRYREGPRGRGLQPRDSEEEN